MPVPLTVPPSSSRMPVTVVVRPVPASDRGRPVTKSATGAAGMTILPHVNRSEVVADKWTKVYNSPVDPRCSPRINPRFVGRPDEDEVGRAAGRPSGRSAEPRGGAFDASRR